MATAREQGPQVTVRTGDRVANLHNRERTVCDAGSRQSGNPARGPRAERCDSTFTEQRLREDTVGL